MPTFGDYDGDGRLDLFVSGYVHYDQDQPPGLDGKSVASNFCQFRGVSVMCGPRGLKGEHDHLFHNNGDGTFSDVSKKLGVDDPNGYYGFTSIFVDLNNDGKVDLLVADDSTPNYLYINKGNGTFEDDSYASGYALNENGRETASMGVAVGDYQNNGRLGLFNTTFSDDYDVLYRNDGDANYTDDSYAAGVAEPTVPFLGWATEFIDYDNDGWKDLFLVNGHVYPMVDQNNWGTTYAERPLLFHNQLGKKFDLVPAVEGTGLALVMPARGAAFGDLFNDGRIDAVINNIDSVPVLLRNVNPDHHHWVELSLIGGPKSPRDAVGATVYLTAAGMRQRGDVLSGGSFVSSNDPRVHFGLGDADKVDAVENSLAQRPKGKSKPPRGGQDFHRRRRQGHFPKPSPPARRTEWIRTCNFRTAATILCAIAGSWFPLTAPSVPGRVRSAAPTRRLPSTTIPNAIYAPGMCAQAAREPALRQRLCLYQRLRRAPARLPREDRRDRPRAVARRDRARHLSRVVFPSRPQLDPGRHGSARHRACGRSLDSGVHRPRCPRRRFATCRYLKIAAR